MERYDAESIRDLDKERDTNLDVYLIQEQNIYKGVVDDNAI